MLGEPDEEPLAEEIRAGTQIGRYEIGGLIGCGSSGDIYSGSDRELGRRVALKFITQENSGEDAATRRFIREAHAASALNHPNIVTVHEVITWESSPVIVMELVQGAALRTLCGRPMPVARAVRIGSQLLDALAYAHSNGIVHRDLKPENIMVRPDGYVKVLDFGLARQMFVAANSGQNLSSNAGLPVGTLRYMSPEQCRGEQAATASDVFAAGIVLYEILAGRHPFEADSPLDTAHAIMWSDPPPLRLWNPEVPASTGELIGKMLNKEAAERPSSAEAAEGLAIEGRLRADGLRGPSAIGHQSRRRFVPAAVLTVVLIGVLVGALRFRKSVTAIPPSAEITITPLASLRGAERHPSVSPDGTRVAFAYTEEREADTHIYIKNLSDASLVWLTSGELPDFQPVFSPDGGRVAFLRQANGRLRVMVIPSKGGIERQVAEITDLLREYRMIEWGADGQNLMVCDRPSEFRPNVAIFEVSVETGARRQITFPPEGLSDWMPEVSPDGGTLGFARVLETGRGDLWAIPMPVAAKQQPNRERRLTDSGDVFYPWAWAPGGRELLMSYRRSDRHRLWRQPVAGGRQSRVAGLDDEVRELSVARHASVAVYGHGAPIDHNVWRYPLPPSKDPPKPLIASASFDGDARYSPDGGQIAFVSDRSGQAEIWICSSDGSNARQVTTLAGGGFWAGSPAWSPDGKWIAFDSRVPGTESSVFVMSSSGGKPRRLTGPGPSDIIPAWSRDSRSVYFASGRGGQGLQVWKVPLSEGAPVQITQNGGLEAFESPDGRFLYYTKRGRTSGFWRMPLEGGAEIPVSGLESIGNRYWERSPKGIYFVTRSHQPALRLFHFATGEITKIMDLAVPPSLVYRGLSMSPDGRSFLYLHPDVGRSNLMLVENFH